MCIAIRADASIQIGTGHIMRCLTLAEAFRDLGVTVEFITRAHPGNMNEHIRSKGFKVHSLPGVNESGLQQSPDGYEQWLGVSQEKDAEETIEVLADTHLNWLIIDHYALDQYWEEKLRHHTRKIMVIDDLVDRSHACDLLLDQNLGRQPTDYVRLVPKFCTVLAGPQYALLRPEFSALREYSLKRREIPALKQILITMGGVDQPDATGLVLETLKVCPIPEDCRITAVMGAHAPWLDKVRSVAQNMPWQTEVQVNINNIAQVMADSDLAIGAAGSTLWERACLGLPSLLVVLANNQWHGAKKLDAANAAHLLGDMSCFKTALIEQMSHMMSSDELRDMSINARAITDGQGLGRTIKYFGLQQRGIL